MCYTQSSYGSRDSRFTNPALRDQFERNIANSPDVTLQYYANLYGITTIYPARHLDDCDIEPRLL